MAITTYDELVAAVGAWLERSDLSTRAADFVTLAEAQINRALRVREMETRASLSTSPNVETVSLPTDFLQAKSLTLSDGTSSWIVDPQPAEVLEEATPRTGAPALYALVGSTMQFYPTPTTTYSGTLIYYARIPALSATTQTNWLLTKAPDAYLYGALTQAAAFLEDDTGTAGMFTSLYDAAITALKAEQPTKVGKLTTDHPSRRGAGYDVYRDF